MGRLYLIIACALACAVASMALALPARGSGDQPMKWSKHQWRSDLFDTYPLRPRYHRTRIIAHVVHLKVVQQQALRPQQASRAPARPLVLRNGRPLAAAPPRSASTARAADDCSGMLVLRWDGDRARRICH